MTSVSSDSFNSFKFTVSSEERGLFLDDFLSKHLSISKKEAKKLLDSSLCQVNGRIERMAGRPLFASDVIEGMLRQERPLAFDPSRIFYEEKTFLLYDKPINVTVDVELLKEITPKGWSLIHRLDRETSGLLLIAKNEETRRKFESLFREKKVQKRYLAWVEDRGLAPQGHLKTYFGKGSSLAGRPRFQVTNSPTDLVAETSWEVVKKVGKNLLVALYPVTGRTHQLRVHLAHLGHPILGDTLYNPDASGRLLLHAEGLIFPHPSAGKEMRFTLPSESFI